MATDGEMLNRMGSSPSPMTELQKAMHDIPYYRRLGGHAYKQHMAHIKNLERKAKKYERKTNEPNQ